MPQKLILDVADHLLKIFPPLFGTLTALLLSQWILQKYPWFDTY
jgi:hypothetical protein